MASAVEFAGLRRKRSPLAEAFFAPPNLTDISLIRTLDSISRDLVTAYWSPATALPFQRRNARSLVLKVKILLSLFEFLKDPSFSILLPSSAAVCLKELYILIYRSRLLLDYCSQSGRLWLLLQNPMISSHFHDLNQEIATILDVLPIHALSLGYDLKEQLQLLCRQARRSKLYIDRQDEMLRLRIFHFLDEFDKEQASDREKLRFVFVDRLGMKSAEACRLEINFLEEKIFRGEEDACDPSILGGVVALTRYCRFLLFGLVEKSDESSNLDKLKKIMSFKGIEDVSITIPKDFCCPISLDLMRDPVIISTGQTYDRSSISRWMEDGHNTCPNSGQILAHTGLAPNKALRSLISQWCSAHGIPYDHHKSSETAAENVAAASSTRSAMKANRATARILVGKLDKGSEDEISVASRELRLLAKTSKENRACIAEEGAIPLLKKLLSSPNLIVQENSVTAILNLSIHDKNKKRIMEEEGCLNSIVDVLRNGRSVEARENAAATLFSLSAVHDYKKSISDEPGAVEALAQLLMHWGPRGKKDAVSALFNLSTHSGCRRSMINSGGVRALVRALSMEGVVEEAAETLALLVRQKTVAGAACGDDSLVASLVTLMRRGSPKAKESAVSALNELCRNGGAALTQRIVRMPGIGGLIQMLLFTGTKRARRKAASLARMCQGSEMAAMGSRGGSARRSSSFAGGDVSVSVAVSVL